MYTRAQPHHFEAQFGPEKVSNMEECFNVLFDDLALLAAEVRALSATVAILVSIGAGSDGAAGATGATGADGAQPQQIFTLLAYAFDRVKFIEDALKIVYKTKDLPVPVEMALLEDELTNG